MNSSSSDISVPCPSSFFINNFPTSFSSPLFVFVTVTLLSFQVPYIIKCISPVVWFILSAIIVPTWFPEAELTFDLGAKIIPDVVPPVVIVPSYGLSSL